MSRPVRVVAEVTCPTCEGAGVIPTVEQPAGHHCRPCEGKGVIYVDVTCRSCRYWWDGMCTRALMLSTLMWVDMPKPPVHTDGGFACNMWAQR